MKAIEIIIDKAWLKEHTGIGATAGKILKDLMEEKQWDYFRWLVVRVMSHAQKVEWAVFSAEQVIDIFEKKYPNDQRPRKAIQAAKDWLCNPSVESSAAAREARRAADAAAYAAADAADAAAYADAYAAYAADAAAYAAAASREKMRRLLAEKAIEILSGEMDGAAKQTESEASPAATPDVGV